MRFTFYIMTVLLFCFGQWTTILNAHFPDDRSNLPYLGYTREESEEMEKQEAIRRAYQPSSFEVVIKKCYASTRDYIEQDILNGVSLYWFWAEPERWRLILRKRNTDLNMYFVFENFSLTQKFSYHKDDKGFDDALVLDSFFSLAEARKYLYSKYQYRGNIEHPDDIPPEADGLIYGFIFWAINFQSRIFQDGRILMCAHFVAEGKGGRLVYASSGGKLRLLLKFHPGDLDAFVFKEDNSLDIIDGFPGFPSVRPVIQITPVEGGWSVNYVRRESHRRRDDVHFSSFCLPRFIKPAETSSSPSTDSTKK